jgi:hypothetical protein
MKERLRMRGFMVPDDTSELPGLEDAAPDGASAFAEDTDEQDEES